VQKVEVGSYDDPIKCGTKIRACESSDPYIAVACGKGNHVKVFSTHRGDKASISTLWRVTQKLQASGSQRPLKLLKPSDVNWTAPFTL